MLQFYVCATKLSASAPLLYAKKEGQGLCVGLKQVLANCSEDSNEKQGLAQAVFT